MSQILRHYLTKEGRVRKFFNCLLRIKEPCVRKFEGVTSSKILGILQTVMFIVATVPDSHEFFRLFTPFDFNFKAYPNISCAHLFSKRHYYVLFGFTDGRRGSSKHTFCHGIVSVVDSMKCYCDCLLGNSISEVTCMSLAAACNTGSSGAVTNSLNSVDLEDITTSLTQRHI